MIGIIGAMHIEIEAIKQKLSGPTTKVISGLTFTTGKFCGVEVVLCSRAIGKVSAGICSLIMIKEYGVKAIINVGVGGNLSDTLKIGDIAIATKVVQHDVDTSPVGDPVGMVSGIDMIEFPCDQRIVDIIEAGTKNLGLGSRRGVIATGDVFVSTNEQKERIRKYFKDTICCEMEGGAVGQVCYMNSVPFAVIRAISDNADGVSPSDFGKFTFEVAENNTKIMEYIITKI